MNLAALTTESRNPATRDLDAMSIPDVVRAMNDEDRRVPEAVALALGEVALAADLAARSLARGGRLVYLGAGTSGRIALLDAAECPPTFGTDPSQVLALLAGGPSAFTAAVEGAEDDVEAGRRDVADALVGGLDTVVGLSASGRTPYVVAGLEESRARGAATVAVSCNLGALASAQADVAVEIDAGPEVLTGSTRLKAGTAQKLVVNMISTAAMVATGKTYQNLMVDMRPTNGKLADRAVRIVAEAADTDPVQATSALEQAGGEAKVAIVMLLADVSAAGARHALARGGGSVRAAVAEASSGSGLRGWDR